MVVEMKNFVRIGILLVLCATSLFSLNLSEVIALAIENSDKVKEQEHLSAQSKNVCPICQTLPKT